MPLRTTSGQTSPSFLIGVTVLVLGVVAYFAWPYFRPSHHVRSERIVRAFARTIGKEVNEFRRATRKLGRRKLDSPQELTEALAEVDESAEEAVDRIEERADEARDKLASLDIALNTQRNRNRRIDAREEEAREAVTGLAAEAKSRLRGED